MTDVAVVSYLGSTLMELGRRQKKKAIVGVCTVGGMSTAAFLERVQLLTGSR